jgi:hypothetical protein
MKIIALFVLLVLIPFVYAASASGIISFNLDKYSVEQGEIVTLTGQVQQNNAGKPVGIEIKDADGDIILIRTVTADSSGNFSLQFKVPTSAAVGTLSIIAIVEIDGLAYSESGSASVKKATTSSAPVVKEEPIPEPVDAPEPEVVAEPKVAAEPETKERLSFVDETKDPSDYVKRYLNEETYKDWFHENFPDYTIYEGIGITQEEYRTIVNELTVPVSEPEPQSQPEPVIEETIVAEPEPEPTTTQSSKGGGCLIATAAFGSEMAPQVQFLRELRDNTVLQTTSGTTFMNGFNQFYYSFSPQIADYERENPVFKEAVKVSLTPLLTSLTLLNYVDVDTEVEMLGYGIGIILLNIGMYFVAPAILVISIKNKLKK